MDGSIEEVTITMLVTDKGVVLLPSKDDRDGYEQAIVDEVRSALSYAGVTRFEVRTLTLKVPLCAPVAPETTDASETLTQVEMPTELVDRLRREHGAQEAERLMSMLIQTIAPGTYEVTRDPNSRGIRKIG